MQNNIIFSWNWRALKCIKWIIKTDHLKYFNVLSTTADNFYWFHPPIVSYKNTYSVTRSCMFFWSDHKYLITAFVTVSNKLRHAKKETYKIFLSNEFFISHLCHDFSVDSVNPKRICSSIKLRSHKIIHFYIYFFLLRSKNAIICDWSWTAKKKILIKLFLSIVVLFVAFVSFHYKIHKIIHFCSGKQKSFTTLLCFSKQLDAICFCLRVCFHCFKTVIVKYREFFKRLILLRKFSKHKKFLEILRKFLKNLSLCIWSHWDLTF